MQNAENSSVTLIKAHELLDCLFSQILTDTTRFDPDVFELTKRHLGEETPHSKAGNNLAEELIELAKRRATAGNI